MDKPEDNDSRSDGSDMLRGILEHTEFQILICRGVVTGPDLRLILCKQSLNPFDDHLATEPQPETLPVIATRLRLGSPFVDAVCQALRISHFQRAYVGMLSL